MIQDDDPAVSVVLALQRAYQDQDVAAAEPLIADDLRFTSPQDAGIDRAAFLERCFPTARHFASYRIVDAVAVGDQDAGSDVLLRYEYTLDDGSRWRNVEAITVADGQVHEIQVHFGGRLG